MSTNFINFLLVGLYFLGVIIIGWRTGKRETPQDFIIASKKVGFFRTTASIFAVLGGEVLIGQTVIAYSLGFTAFWFWIGFAIGAILLGLAASKIKTLGDKYGLINLSEYFGVRWGKKNKIFAAIIVLVVFFAILAIQFMATGAIISPLLNISYSLVVIVTGLVVLIYILLGGYKAVIATDLLQAILMVFIAIAIMLFMKPGEINFSQFVSDITPELFISFVLIGIFMVFASADVWQRIYSARTVKIARNSFFAVAVLFLTFGFFMTLIGINARNHFPDADPNQALYWGLFALLPVWLFGLAVVMILATVMSTIDTEVYLLSSMVAKDFIAHFKKGVDDKQLTRIISYAMAVISVLAMIMAIFVKDIMTVLFGLVSLMLSLSPVIVSSIFWRLKPKAVFLSMTGGILAFLALIIFGQFTTENSVATLPASLVFLIIGQLIFKGSELEAAS